MRVQFVQSGGVVGTVKGCELDTATLSTEAAEELQQLVRESGLSTSTKSIFDAGRDLHQYEITIDDGKRKVSVVLDDVTVPKSAKALIGYLKKSARPKAVD